MFTLIVFLGIVALLIQNHNHSKRLLALEQKLGVAPGSVPNNSQVTTAPLPTQQPQASLPQASLAPSVPAAPVLPSFSTVQWITGVGVLALVLGMGFFLKYAIDQGWITETMRIVLGLFVGLLLATLGELWHKKHEKYANALSAGGIAVLYFTIYATHAFYSLISSDAAFILTIILSVITFFLKYRYTTKLFAVLSIVGAYLAPILFMPNLGQFNVLFPYLTIVTIVSMLLFFKEEGFEILFLSLFGFAINYVIWADKNQLFLFMTQAVTLLSINAFIYFIGSAVAVRKKTEVAKFSSEIETHAGLWFGMMGMFFVAAFWQQFSLFYREYTPLVLALLGTLTLLTYLILDRLEYVKINYTLALLSGALLTLAIFKQFTMPMEGYYLLLLAVIGLLVGKFYDRPEIRLAAFGVLMFATLRAIFQDQPKAAEFLLNARFALIITTALVFIFAGWLYRTVSDLAYDVSMRKLYFPIAALIIWFAVSVEILANFGTYDTGNSRNLLLSMWWIGYAVLLTLIGGYFKQAVFRKMAALLFVLSILKVFLYDVSALDTGYRIVSFIVLGIILLTMAFAYQKNKEKINQFLDTPQKS
jgi:uncharacterized membrane protein